MSDPAPAADDAAEDGPQGTRRVMTGRPRNYFDPGEYAEVDADAADHWDQRIWFRSP
ncbi:hypothetical protein [Nocardia cyriacigeorgica]|uniref:hypothetical protein n=1 Tax=Nocardia cyriacigeorgica TaxID=135487 RepID=UPI00245911FC|nr:hypothetical protein [Nocardia cyriacigeorgica]